MADCSDQGQRLMDRHPGRLLKYLLPIGYLVVLILTVSLMKVGLASPRLHWSSVDPPGLYWTEQALQYRYAKMVAEGDSIPVHDTKLQYPGGVDTFQSLTVFLEYLIGYSYRLLDQFSINIPFHVFVTWFTSFFLTLSVVCVYCFTALVFRSQLAAVLSSLLYALSTPSASRSIMTCNREDIALPFLFGATVLLAASACCGRRSLAVLGSLLMAISLAAWHFSRFYFLAVVASLAVLYLFSDRKNLRRLAFIFCSLTATTILAGLLVPVLRASRFWSSPHTILCLSTTIAILWEVSRERLQHDKADVSQASFAAVFAKRACCIGVIAAPILVVTMLLNTEQAGFGHVWELLVEKVRHLGVKPASPSSLPFQARALWIDGFNGPTFHYIVTGFWAIIPIGLVSLVRITKALRGQVQKQSEIRLVPLMFLVLLAVIFTGLFFLVERLSVFVVFFWAVLCGGAVQNLGRRSSWAVAAGLVPFALVMAYGFQDIKQQTVIHRTIDAAIGYEHQPATFMWKKGFDDSSLVHWVRENTPPDSVFMARFFVAPLLLTYADRAIVVQPKWEVPGSRERVRRIHEAFYGTEASLATLCEELGVQYYLLDGRATLDASPDSDRFTADALQLATSTPAFRMQFAPQSLTRFQLVYQNRYYRLFKLVAQNREDGVERFPYQPFYDIARFGGQTGKEPFFDDSHTFAVLSECRRADDLLVEGAEALSRRVYAEGNRCFNEALSIDPSIHGGHLYRGVALMEMGLRDQAAQEFATEVSIHPYCPMAAYQLGHICMLREDWQGALQAFKRCHELDPDLPGVVQRAREAEYAMTHR